MGTGIWSMHFIGMLAFHLPIPLAYDELITALSMAIAIFASGLALFVVSRAAVSGWSLAVGAVLMGLGVAAMHYTGMQAMQMSPAINYDPSLRSEEHTSELQSLMRISDAVFCLKKKNK